MASIQRPLTIRAIAFAAAAAFVCAAALLAIGLRFPLSRDDLAVDSAVVSEMTRPVLPEAPRPNRSLQPPPPPPPAPSPETSATPAPASTPAIARAPAELVQIDTPRWLTRPRNPERFYPREAFMQGIEGRVELACLVEVDGRLNCEVQSEAPAGHGFGEAALALAHAHTMAPAMLNGEPVRGRYRMVVPFSAGG